MKVLGLMSGTSVDGVDAAVVEIKGAPPELAVELVSFTFVPYEAWQRAEIFRLFEPATSTVDAICRLNFQLGEWLAQAAHQAMQAAGLAAGEIELIGSHGQTIYHSVEAGARPKSTLQIGEAAVIAERTGITTVADFRVADVAAGGQGAPLVSYIDWLLLRHPTHSRAVQNIGGIANVTYLPPACRPEQVIAFDTGPGNMLIDAAVRRLTGGAQSFDEDGRLAATGQIDPALLDALLARPYFSRPLPKTTGREQFGEALAGEVWEQAQAMGLAGPSLVATLTAFTAASIAAAYHRYLPHFPTEVILGGGGARNGTLVALLEKYLAPARVLSHEAVGLTSDAKEAIAFAVLAYETLHGRPGNLPSCTHARRPVVLGKITPGHNYGT